jgi:hypothetical protein
VGIHFRARTFGSTREREREPAEHVAESSSGSAGPQEGAIPVQRGLKGNLGAVEVEPTWSA